MSEERNVSYITLEAVMSRYERALKKVLIATSLVTLGSNIAWVIAFHQRKEN